MARNWQRFEDPLPHERNEIYVSMNYLGELAMNRHTFETLGRPEGAFMLYDPDTDSIGIEKTEPLMPNAFKVKPKSDCGGAYIRLLRRVGPRRPHHPAQAPASTPSPASPPRAGASTSSSSTPTSPTTAITGTPVLPLIPVGGLLIADNILWSGKVLRPQEASDHAIVRFNARVAADPRVEHVLLSVRDGIMLARKLRD